VTAEQLAEVILDALGDEAHPDNAPYVSFDEGHLNEVVIDGRFDLTIVAAAVLKALL